MRSSTFKERNVCGNEGKLTGSRQDHIGKLMSFCTCSRIMSTSYKEKIILILLKVFFRSIAYKKYCAAINGEKFERSSSTCLGFLMNVSLTP